jgi:TrmH family RNA methyltransferase
VTVLLDGIRDPGNMGTIIRICDWFGVNQIICSEDTVDAYNPKVVQASMGSLSRLQPYYTDLKNYLDENKKDSKINVYGASLHGESIYKMEMQLPCFLLIGNESEGIREYLHHEIDFHITIASNKKDVNGPESLNAAVATGIICSEIFRQNQ